MAKVTMPQLGESVAEGTIGKWLKQPGDHVDKYEALVEVVTDKVNAEVPSPFEGILREILVEEGATVPNNAEIAVIETAADGDVAEPAAASAASAPVVTSAPAASPAAPAPEVAVGPAGSDERGPAESAASAPASSASAPAAPAAAAAAAAAAAPAAPASAPAAPASAPAAAAAAPGLAQPTPAADPDARMTPAVRRLLREHDLSAAQVQGTGGGGRITRDDVLLVVESIRTGTAAPAAPAAPAAASAGSRAPAPALPAGAGIEFPDGADEVLLPMTQMRKGIAAQMTRCARRPACLRPDGGRCQRAGPRSRAGQA